MPHPDDLGARRLYDEFFLKDFFTDRPLLPDLPPSFEERADRCRAMGLVLCTCTGVDRNDQPRLLIYDPACEVHGKVA